MKKLLLTSLLLATKAAFCGDPWFTIPLSSLSTMTITGASTKITLQAPDGSLVTVGGGANAVQTGQVDIIPPAGREKEWESLILTAMSTGCNIRVSGTSAGNTITSPSSPS